MHPSVPSAVSRQDTHILVVDDVEQNLVAIEALLTRPGVTVLKANSGVAALEILLVQEVALILLDVQMPNMNGFELAELVRGNPQTRHIPLIFLTAAINEPQRSFRGYQAGAVDFLHKPVEPDVLRSKVNVFVELFAQKKQLSAQLDELRQALHVNEMFTAVLGHDLRNPLAAVLNGAELLLLMSSDQKVGAVASRIRSSARRMEKMVSQLLDVARIRAGGVALELCRGDYAQLCRRIVDELKQAGHANPVQIDASGSTDGLFDPHRIGQVLSNLLGNALQHGDPVASVAVRIDGTDASQLTLSIHNRGAMPAAVMEQAFTPFRPGRDARRQPGLGLGLYIAKYFVDAHGGSIALASSEADGTTFTITLPRETVKVDVPGPAAGEYAAS
nr:hybrid sensor histidine kinase/response regulator [uncultured Noviherbaspirillum sp.]